MKTIFLAALVALLAHGQASAERRSVTIATEGALKPWNYVTAAGELAGFELDLGRELCRRADLDCRFVAQDWDGMIPALQQGRYDAIMAGMMITDKRLQTIDFAGPYATGPSQFGVPAGSALAGVAVDLQRADLNDDTPALRAGLERMRAALRGRTVGVQVSTVQAAVLERYFPEATVRFYDKIPSAGFDLGAGRLDAVFVDRAGLNGIIDAEQGRVVPFGPAFSRGPLGRGVGVGLRKGDGLKALLDKAIHEATADGTIAALAGRHFGYDVSLPTD